jgi:hypothetical protein
MKRGRRSVLLMLGLLLLGGAIVNVAVAWGCAWWVNSFEHRTAEVGATIADGSLPEGFAWLVTRRDAFGATRIIAMPRGKPSDATDATDIFPSWSDLPATMSERSAQAANIPRDPGARNPPRPVALVDDARGWPVRALTCHWDRGMTVKSQYSSVQTPTRGIELPIFGGQQNAGGLDYVRGLPLAIWWPGFAINTLFYAAILWLLFAAPFALRRRRRIKHGLCAKCGYDLRGIPPQTINCPECGALRTKSPAASCPAT